MCLSLGRAVCSRAGSNVCKFAGVRVKVLTGHRRMEQQQEIECTAAGKSRLPIKTQRDRGGRQKENQYEQMVRKHLLQGSGAAKRLRHLPTPALVWLFKQLNAECGSDVVDGAKTCDLHGSG